MTPSTHGKICEILKRYMDADGLAEIMPLLDNEVDETASGAEDRALRSYSSSAVRRVAEFNKAVVVCRSVLGEAPMTFDSAEAVYGAALRKRGVDLGGVSPSSYQMLFENIGTVSVSKPAMDRAARKHPKIAASLDRVTQL